MGRKFYEEIGHPFPNRRNVIVSGTKKFAGDNLETDCAKSGRDVWVM